jgi:hypothetical protein
MCLGTVWRWTPSGEGREERILMGEEDGSRMNKYI